MTAVPNEHPKDFDQFRAELSQLRASLRGAEVDAQLRETRRQLREERTRRAAERDARMKRSEALGSVRDDQRPLVDFLGELDESVGHTVERVVDLENITREFSDRLDQLRLQVEAFCGDGTHHHHRADQLVNHLCVGVDDPGQGFGVAKVAYRVALNVADVLKLGFRRVYQAVNSLAEFSRDVVKRVAGHDASPSLGADTSSVGVGCARAGNSPTGAGPGRAGGVS